MINVSSDFTAAITEDSRRMLLKVVLEIIDPDLVYGNVDGSDQAEYSKPEQLHDKVMEGGAPFATLEPNRWLLNGAFDIMPDDFSSITTSVGVVTKALSDINGQFGEMQVITQNFSGVTVLQACQISFSGQVSDGVPADFTVEILQGGTVYHTETFVGNAKASVTISDFTVYNPDAIRITVSRMSVPSRRLRIIEAIAGLYEEWSDLATLNIVQQGDVSCLTLPYGTCTLSMDNSDRTFEPRSKSGLFKSIEERQGLDVMLGVKLSDVGTSEYVRVGKFYQFSGGWKTGSNGLSMQWDLVDIIGLLTDRRYLPPETLPTTLDGWVASIVALLGVNFEGLYDIAEGYADLPLTVNGAEDVNTLLCGELLRYCCMATGTWPRAASGTGLLTISPLWQNGGLLTLDNLTKYPVIKANDDVASLIFTLFDGNSTQYVVSGTSTSSSNSVTIANPFIHSEQQALTAARLILSTYGGNKLETVGRGDPSCEIGDVDTVALDESSATTGRRLMQTFSFESGVMKNCQSMLLQADGSYLFENREIITKSGVWIAPAGVSTLRVIIVGGGSGGYDGEDGTFYSSGADGADGLGGKVWSDVISINEQQSFNVVIGSGGAVGTAGKETVFGVYTSADGAQYSPAFTDVANGDAYGRSGVRSTVSGSGDGGKGGKGGAQGYMHYETIDMSWTPVVDLNPEPGKPGTAGASGCVVVYWDKVGE